MTIFPTKPTRCQGVRVSQQGGSYCKSYGSFIRQKCQQGQLHLARKSLVKALDISHKEIGQIFERLQPGIHAGQNIFGNPFPFKMPPPNSCLGNVVPFAQELMIQVFLSKVLIYSRRHPKNSVTLGFDRSKAMQRCLLFFFVGSLEFHQVKKNILAHQHVPHPDMFL